MPLLCFYRPKCHFTFFLLILQKPSDTCAQKGSNVKVMNYLLTKPMGQWPSNLKLNELDLSQFLWQILYFLRYSKFSQLADFVTRESTAKCQCVTKQKVVNLTFGTKKN